MIASLLALAAFVSLAQPPAIEGVWHNPRNSVAVRTGACGASLCGWVIRASDKAQADAVEGGGGGKLIGTALLRGYRASGQARWSGQVYVPDMNRSFGSTITLVDANTIEVKGCLIGGFFCKTQRWRRD